MVCTSLYVDDENEPQDDCRDRAAGAGMISMGACVERDANAIGIDRGVEGRELIVDLDNIESDVDVYDIWSVAKRYSFRFVSLDYERLDCYNR